MTEIINQRVSDYEQIIANQQQQQEDLSGNQIASDNQENNQENQFNNNESLNLQQQRDSNFQQEEFQQQLQVSQEQLSTHTVEDQDQNDDKQNQDSQFDNEQHLNINYRESDKVSEELTPNSHDHLDQQQFHDQNSQQQNDLNEQKSQKSQNEVQENQEFEPIFNQQDQKEQYEERMQIDTTMLEQSFRQISLEQQREEYAKQNYGEEVDEFGTHLNPVRQEELEEQAGLNRTQQLQRQALPQQQQQIQKPIQMQQLPNGFISQRPPQPVPMQSNSIHNPEEQQYNRVSSQKQINSGSVNAFPNLNQAIVNTSAFQQKLQLENEQNQRKINENYKLFCQYLYQEIIKKQPHLVTDGDKVAILIAAEWKKLPLDQKLNYSPPPPQLQQAQQQMRQTLELNQTQPVLQGQFRPQLPIQQMHHTQQQQSYQQLNPMQNQQVLLQQNPQPYHSTQSYQSNSGLDMKLKKQRRTKHELAMAAEKPKKCMTPYLYFVKLNRARIGQENPGRSFKEMMQLISQLWAQLPPHDKIQYEQMSNQDRIRHDNEMREYQINVIQKGVKPIKKQRRTRTSKTINLMPGQKPKGSYDSGASQQNMGNVMNLYNMIQQQNQIINMLLTQQNQFVAGQQQNTQQNIAVGNAQQMQQQQLNNQGQQMYGGLF
eukprot:403334714